MLKSESLTYPVYVRKIPFLVLFISYWQTGYLLHIISLLAIFLSFVFYQLTSWSLQSGNHISAIINGYLFLWLSSLPFFAQLDARSRFQNYKLLRDLLYRYGFRYKFVKALRHSRCQRDAALVAAKEMGYKFITEKYYRRCGYRWYHLLPDFIFKHPFYLFTKSFWITTFFARTYHSKYFND